jgi:hypothetical protein
MAKEVRKWLFSYHFHGDRYSFTIPAASEAEAQLRLRQMATAVLDGEVVATVALPFGPWRWLARVFGRS